MRIKILVLGLVCFIFVYCGIPTAQQIKLYPESSETLYSQMILTLQELGCIIKHTDKNSMIILAEMINLGKDPMGIMHTSDPPLQISINFKKENGKSLISISITGQGQLLTMKEPERQIKRILEKLEEQLKK